MSAIGLNSAVNSEISRLDGEMVELALLLPSWQANALEDAAADQGLTTGQMVRTLIRDFFDQVHGLRAHGLRGLHGSRD